MTSQLSAYCFWTFRIRIGLEYPQRNACIFQPASASPAKYVGLLEEHGLITTERTVVIDRKNLRTTAGGEARYGIHSIRERAERITRNVYAATEDGGM